MLTTIRILKPSYVVGENVAGLVSMENGKTLDRILSDLADEGYKTEQFIIPACSTGTIHRRDRLWIIAHSPSYAKPRQIRKDESVNCRGSSINEQKIWGQFQTVQYDKLDAISWTSVNTNNNGLEGNSSKSQTRRNVDGFFESVDWSNYSYQSAVCRTSDGIPNRVDRIKSLGNAIVPQIAFEIFKAIEQLETELKKYDQPI